MSARKESRSRGAEQPEHALRPLTGDRHASPDSLFITFEGVEGAGKTTQIHLLREALEALGRRVVAAREPGGTPSGESIRSVLLATDDPVTPAAETLLFLAARAQLTERVIRPALESGAIVICDRFTDSTLAYQGYARGYDVDWLRQLNAFATGGLQPDLTFLLDLDPVDGLGRQRDRNRMEAESLAFHRRVRLGFQEIANAEPDRIVLIDATRPIQSVHSAILSVLTRCPTDPIA